MRYNKVEICGVNTSLLKVLNDEEKRDLLLKVRSGNTRARDELISGNLRLVLSIIQRFASRCDNMDDLFQVGCIGLIKAIDNLPKIVKLILCIPAIAIVWMIYRVCRSLQKNNMIGVILAVVLIFVGVPFMWLIDLVCILLKGNIWWID